jgi:hypothetical protein
MEDYAHGIRRSNQSVKTNGNLVAAVTQDLMCEPFILEKTGLTIEDHQKITVERYARLIDLTNVYVMPVLQGYSPESYAAHLALYGELLIPGQWVGVGSVCKQRTPRSDRRHSPGNQNTASGSAPAWFRFEARSAAELRRSRLAPQLRQHGLEFLGAESGD